MISREHAITMAAYNRWMNERLYACCARLSDTERKEDVGAFFKSIHGTLNHLLLADRVWLGRFTGKPFAVTSLDQELHAAFEALQSERVATDAAIVDWVSASSDADFGRDLHYTTLVNPQPRRTPLWLAATHFFNHQTHHRGQLTTLLMQRRIDPGVTDLLWLPELQPGAR
jgi:uncharacterized damage-inducible protein DinB